MRRLAKAVATGVVAMAAAVAIPGPSRADFIMFDPDNGGNAPKNVVNTFQYGAMNALGQASIPTTTGSTFQLLFQGQLNSIITNTGAQVTPAGLNASGTVGTVAPYEITVVGSATEIVNGGNVGSTATFQLAPVQNPNSFIEIYYDPLQDANALQGTGYNNGTLILRALATPTTPNVSNFSLTNPQPSPLPNFDSFGNNDYSTAGPGGTNITSVKGSGSTKFDAIITYLDPTFFIAPAVGDSGRQLVVGDLMNFDVGQFSPFDKIDPSKRFTTVANAGTGSGPAPTYFANVGSINGVSGPDFQFQALAENNFTGAIPEPTSMTLLGLGLAGVFGYGWRRREQAA